MAGDETEGMASGKGCMRIPRMEVADDAMPWIPNAPLDVSFG
jgi:hypothetical protein